MNKDTLISFKFCGGCNPLYDRNGVYTHLREYFDEEKLRNITKTTLIILNGCNAGCMKSSDYEGSYDRIIDLHQYLMLPTSNKSTKDIADWVIQNIQ